VGRKGTYTNSERRVSKVNRPSRRPEKRNRISYLSQLAACWACARDFPRLEQAVDAFEEWKRVSAGELCDYSSMTCKAIEIAAVCNGRFRQHLRQRDATSAPMAASADDGRASHPGGVEPFPSSD
jgi:hypothetical protein